MANPLIISMAKKKDEIEIEIDLSKIKNIGRRLEKFAKKKKKFLIPLLLILIFIFSLELRLFSAKYKYLLAYDPYFWYRHAKFIAEPGYRPAWDELSYYPPGRPWVFNLFEYVLAYSYKLVNLFANVDFLTICKYVPAIIASLAVFPAYSIARDLKDEKAGLFSALIIGIVPIFLQRTMAGFCDTDCFVVLMPLVFFALSIKAFKNVRKNKLTVKTWVYCILAGLSFFVFKLIWPGDYVLFVLGACVATTLVLKVLLKKYAKIEVSFFNASERGIILTFLLILLFSIAFCSLKYPKYILSLINYPIAVLKLKTPTGGAGAGKGPNVFISVAEMQAPTFLQITKSGVNSDYLTRLGYVAFVLPFIWLLIAKPPLLLKRKWKIEDLLLAGIWFILVFLGTFKGIRFILLLTMPAAIISGICISELLDKSFKKNYLAIAFLLVIAFLLIKDVKLSYLIAKSTTPSMDDAWYEALTWLKENTPKDALIATWWDPGHWITAVAERRAFADGAHYAGPPYPISQRIQDMGFVFSTDNETAAIQRLKKYMELNETICKKYNLKYNCPTKASEMYFIASADLIGKFYWLSYFGSWDPKLQAGKPRVYQILYLTNMQQAKNATYYFYPATVNSGIILIVNETSKRFFAQRVIFDVESKRIIGVQNISEVVVYARGLPLKLINENAEDKGLLLVFPGYQMAIYMDEKLKNCIFTKLYFYDGAGLKHFKLIKVFGNGEVKIFKVEFD